MKTHRLPGHVSEAVVRTVAGQVFVLSLLAIVLRLLGIRGDQIPYPPKRFAASIGFSLSALAFVLSAFAGTWAWLLPLAVLSLFSALESFLGFCAGCKIYGLLIRLHIVPEHNCPQCRLR